MLLLPDAPRDGWIALNEHHLRADPLVLILPFPKVTCCTLDHGAETSRKT